MLLCTAIGHPSPPRPTQDPPAHLPVRSPASLPSGHARAIEPPLAVGARSFVGAWANGQAFTRGWNMGC